MKEVCLWCSTPLELILDLGRQPIANNLLESSMDSEPSFPLKFCKCPACGIHQVNRIKRDFLFNDSYPYFSSINKSYVKQCEELANDLKKEFNPNNVLEIGSNDGYMLKNFTDRPHLGYEPTKGPFIESGIHEVNVKNEFFDKPTEIKYDLILALNVLAHIPDPKQIIKNIKESLSPDGIVVVEVQDLEKLIEKRAFDQIYHEHYIYWDINTLELAFRCYDLRLVRYERIDSHCGSIRAYFEHTTYVDASILKTEVPKIRENFLQDLKKYQAEGKKVAAFGAPAKGNTFLNYCEVDGKLINFTVDETPAKQNKFLPGSRIPIYDIQKLLQEKPDICLVLPWNFYEDIKLKLDDLNTWGMECISPIKGMS